MYNNTLYVFLTKLMLPIVFSLQKSPLESNTNSSSTSKVMLIVFGAMFIVWIVAFHYCLIFDCNLNSILYLRKSFLEWKSVWSPLKISNLGEKANALEHMLLSKNAKVAFSGTTKHGVHSKCICFCSNVYVDLDDYMIQIRYNIQHEIYKDWYTFGALFCVRRESSLCKTRRNAL